MARTNVSWAWIAPRSPRATPASSRIQSFEATSELAVLSNSSWVTAQSQECGAEAMRKVLLVPLALVIAGGLAIAQTDGFQRSS